jgi:hypothetical protein
MFTGYSNRQWHLPLVAMDGRHALALHALGRDENSHAVLHHFS